ncbi:MAG: YdcF family protein [Alphaproteobacteria bacterium]
MAHTLGAYLRRFREIRVGRVGHIVSGAVWFWLVLMVLPILLWFVLFLRPAAPSVQLGELVSLSRDQADGIVVLTGGPQRIDTGLLLLYNLTAPRLLVSGVFDDVSDESFSRLHDIPQGVFSCCITLGRSARDTRGNAAEAALWTRSHEVRRVLLVTSDFHMHRALIEFSRKMPEVVFVPVSVPSVYTEPLRWLSRPGAGVHSFVESIKYLLTFMGLSRFGPAQWGFQDEISLS